jgi:hypothetical protein
MSSLLLNWLPLLPSPDRDPLPPLPLLAKRENVAVDLRANEFLIKTDFLLMLDVKPLPLLFIEFIIWRRLLEASPRIDGDVPIDDAYLAMEPLSPDATECR